MNAPRHAAHPLLRPGRLSRRRVLQTAMAAGLLAACGDGVLQPPEGDELASRSLRMLNWGDYIDPTEDGLPGTIERFTADAGIRVDYLPDYVGNIEILETIFEPTLGRGDPTGFDIAVPTYWLAQRMLSNGWLQPIPLELIGNRRNLEPAFLGLPWDRGARFHLPWQVGITGIAHDPEATTRLLGRPLSGVEDLFAPELRGRVSFIGEMREAVGLVMLAAGEDPSAATPAAAHRALDRIEQARAEGQIASFTFEDFADGLAAGRFVASMGWSGDTVLLQQDEPNRFAFTIPPEGAIRWFDTMVIPDGAENPGAAGRFMNYVYDPQQAARITAWVQYISPVIGVQQALVDMGLGDIASSEVLFPDDATERRLRTWGGMNRADEDELEERFAQISGL